jgi:gamma-glutamylcyclotransferase (GGCT)/AIG2-like uncharacterized protein YtfP
MGWRAPDGPGGCAVCGGEGTVQRVFTYGMLLPEARWPAQLNDWRLEFAYYAVIVPSPGSTVLGGVVEASADRLTHMDRQEGVETDLYRRQRVTLADDTEAWVYVQDRPRAQRPDDFYVRDMRREYHRLGHDAGPLEDALNRVGGSTMEAWA